MARLGSCCDERHGWVTFDDVYEIDDFYAVLV